ERVVAPGDVTQRLLHEAVVRSVDDPLLPPGRPGVRPCGAELEPEGGGLAGQDLAPLDGELRGLLEALAAPRLDLDLAGGQLTGDVPRQGGRLAALPERLEPRRQRERLAVENLELLLDRKREILRLRVEPTGALERGVRIGDALAHRPWQVTSRPLPGSTDGR